jgi:uncharacterized membrane protein
MAGFLDVIPRKLLAMVAVPLFLGLVLLALLFELGPVVWALILLVVIGGTLLLVIITARTVLMEKQTGGVDAADSE